MKTLEESKQKMINKCMDDWHTVIESMDGIKNLIYKQGTKDKNFEWNVRTINSCCIELMELNNYMLNEIRRYDILIKNK